jgi:hypothetical protein
VQWYHVVTRHGRHYLNIKVSSRHRTAKIKVIRYSSHHRVLGTKIISVRTGTSLSISLSGSFRSIKVTLVS